jgi:hypothetical protein
MSNRAHENKFCDCCSLGFEKKQRVGIVIRDCQYYGRKLLRAFNLDLISLVPL